MPAWMWHLTDEVAVLFTADRATLQSVLAYPRFPHRDTARATLYTGKNGRAVGWQFSFPAALWNGVVRHLGRAQVTYLDDRTVPPDGRAAVSAPPSLPAPTSPQARKRRATGPAGRPRVP